MHGLRALGYIEGQNLVLERRSAEGKFDRFAEIATELVRARVDVIVTVSLEMAKEAERVTSGDKPQDSKGVGAHRAAGAPRPR